MASHALFGEWGDVLGTVETAVHRGPSDVRRNGPLSPGVSPRTSQFLAAYKDYTTLQEWEAMNSGLSKEVVPVKRRFVVDYLPAGAGAGTHAQVDACAASASASSPLGQQADCSADPNAGGALGSSDSANNASRTAAALDGVATASRAYPSNENRRQRHADKVVEDSNEGAVTALVQQPTPRRQQNALPASTTAQTAGRLCIGLQATPRNATVDNATGIAAMTGSQVHIRVKTVAPSATIDATARPPPKPDEPQVVDRDKGIYGRAKDIRPARKVNATSRKRLNELLKMPQARIEACDTHPSRSFGVVPSQNLRVI